MLCIVALRVLESRKREGHPVATVEPVQGTIHKMVRRLIEKYQPQQIILFGSFASGETDEDSDIDLLIIKDTTESPLERRVHVRRLVSDSERHIPFSPLVLTPEELAHRLALGDPFYQDILQQGKVCYART
jgi:predicted nucleotidyltransferase